MALTLAPVDTWGEPARADVSLAPLPAPARRTLTHDVTSGPDHVTRAAILAGVLKTQPDVLLAVATLEAVRAGALKGVARP